MIHDFVTVGLSVLSADFNFAREGVKIYVETHVRRVEPLRNQQRNLQNMSSLIQYTQWSEQFGAFILPVSKNTEEDRCRFFTFAYFC